MQRVWTAKGSADGFFCWRGSSILTHVVVRPAIGSPHHLYMYMYICAGHMLLSTHHHIVNHVCLLRCRMFPRRKISFLANHVFMIVNWLTAQNSKNFMAASLQAPTPCLPCTPCSQVILCYTTANSSSLSTSDARIFSTITWRSSMNVCATQEGALTVGAYTDISETGVSCFPSLNHAALNLMPSSEQ